MLATRGVTICRVVIIQFNTSSVGVSREKSLREGVGNLMNERTPVYTLITSHPPRYRTR